MRIVCQFPFSDLSFRAACGGWSRFAGMRSWAREPIGTIGAWVKVGMLSGLSDCGSRFMFDVCLKCRRPELFCRFDRVGLQVSPPSPFVAVTMQLLMMVTAERDRVLVADLASKGSGLREFQMVRIARRALADQAGLRCDEGKMGLVAPSHLFAQWRDRCFGGRIFVPGTRCVGRGGAVAALVVWGWG